MEYERNQLLLELSKLQEENTLLKKVLQIRNDEIKVLRSFLKESLPPKNSEFLEEFSDTDNQYWKSALQDNGVDSKSELRRILKVQEISGIDIGNEFSDELIEYEKDYSKGITLYDLNEYY